MLLHECITFLSKSQVSLLLSVQTGRYRLHADTFSPMWLLLDELLYRRRTHSGGGGGGSGRGGGAWHDTHGQHNVQPGQHGVQSGQHGVQPGQHGVQSGVQKIRLHQEGLVEPLPLGDVLAAAEHHLQLLTGLEHAHDALERQYVVTWGGGVWCVWWCVWGCICLHCAWLCMLLMLFSPP